MPNCWAPAVSMFLASNYGDSRLSAKPNTPMASFDAILREKTRMWPS
jgi:hypothetical protein